MNKVKLSTNNNKSDNVRISMKRGARLSYYGSGKPDKTNTIHYGNNKSPFRPIMTIARGFLSAAARLYKIVNFVDFILKLYKFIDYIRTLYGI